MQVFGLPGHVIRNAGRASRLIDAKSPSREAAIRRDAVGRWRAGIAAGLSAAAAARVVGVSRATLYRWEKRAEARSRRPHRLRRPGWPPGLVRAVERLRQDFPMWGRAKLGPILRAEGFAVSDATVGRIVASLVARGLVDSVPVATRRARTRRWTAARRHASRLPKGLKADRPGSLIQIDTVFVQIAPGKHIKHFTAYCPVAKWTVARTFSRATSAAAAAFLDKVVADMPFPIRAIQVDGGSEFKAEFETACAAKGITLYELPPKRPQLNGAVERCNGAWRYEFYAVYDLPTSIEAINPILDSFQHLYNHHRPHQALGGLTPARYLQLLSERDPVPSHMC